MVCPLCCAEMPEGALLCEKCGEEIRVVPDYDPSMDLAFAAQEESEEQSKDPDDTAENNKKKRLKRRIAVYGCFSVLLIAIIVLCVMINKNLKNMNSLEYQLEQADKLRGLGEYSKAIEAYLRAEELDPGNVKVLQDLAGVYFLKNEVSKYEATLLQIMNHKSATDEQIAWAREKVLPIMIQKGNFEGVCKLVTQSQDARLWEQYKEYLSPAPVFSLDEGTYQGIQALTIFCAGNGEVYYTLDGTTPNENSEVYTVPIVLDVGETTVKACLINEYGVKSEIASATYMIQSQAEQK